MWILGHTRRTPKNYCVPALAHASAENPVLVATDAIPDPVRESSPPIPTQIQVLADSRPKYWVAATKLTIYDVPDMEIFCLSESKIRQLIRRIKRC